MQETASEFSRHFYVKDTEHPYTTDPGKPFMWVRARIVGGKTLHWGRMSWRLSDLDFKAATHDGFGDDWPISYAEIAPYYEQAEEFIGVSGYARWNTTSAGWQLHAADDAQLRRAIAPQRRAKDRAPTVSPSRVAMLTAPPKPWMKGRAQVPLLRQLRRRLRCRRDVQLAVFDSARCRSDRPNDASDPTR